MGVINNQQSLLSILINHMHGSSKSDLIRDLLTFTQETTQSRIQTGSQLTLETPRFFLTFCSVLFCFRTRSYIYYTSVSGV